MTPETLQSAAQALVRQIDAVTEQLTDVTLLLSGTLDQAALEEAAMLCDQAAWENHQVCARLEALVVKAREQQP